MMRPMHLERFRGEGDTTCCGLSAVERELDILDEEQAQDWVPDKADVCKTCLRTSRGRESLRSYRQMYELREGERLDDDTTA